MTTKEIKLKIHEEANLYSPYDPEQKLLSEEVTFHLERNYLNKHRSHKENYILHIYSDTPVNEESIRTNFREYFSQEKDNVSYLIKKMTLKQVCLAVFGVIVLGIWLYMSATDTAGIVKTEILSIIGWVAIWEATSIAIMERPELRILQRSYQRIMNARLVFDIVPDEKTPDQ